MCGIAGLVHFDGRPVDEGVLRQMCQALRHRGPDDEGWIAWPAGGAATSGRAAAGLGNRRLSIIDVQGGHQPIANETGEIWTVLNGEIYNFAGLRCTLEKRGHRFSTKSDTEVVTHAYEEFGDACVEHFDGMFALAIWDGPRDRLLLARDRFGKKPLCYHAAGPDFAFASELQALLVVPGVGREIDRDALGDYLAYMAVPAPRTIYRDVRKLPPAHVLVADRQGVRIQRYWSLAYEPKLQIGEDEAVERVRELLGEAVRKRLVGEVPLGAFLSGGVDSSAVVALMARASGRPVKTFSIGFDDPRYNELSHARRVAEAFNCEHHEFVVRPDVLEMLPAMVRHFGEPFADSSAIPSWYLAKLTREHVTVALNGDGGDEVFAGYGRHLANNLAERWSRVPEALRRPTERLACTRLLAGLGGSRAARFATSAGMSRADRYRAWAGVFSADLVRELSDTVPPEEPVVPREFAAAGNLDAVDAMLAVDTRFYLPTDLLPKADITSMAHSLEVRSPLLDRDLAEFVASLPSTLKLRRLTTKYLLKKAASGMVPAVNLRRPKRGFAVPIAQWLRRDLRDFASDHLRPSRLAAAGMFRQQAIDGLLDAHLSGARDYAHHLWVLLMLELWHRTFVQP
ncbi:MAG: asparagine synthase (glutamine-hydrolyzing) [Acidobacteria bacterium]|nr:asparagine synthase (glutamine-hydrolyzing) [Acidobacteriota bacterium]